jgi:hypothetical protein
MLLELSDTEDELRMIEIYETKLPDAAKLTRICREAGEFYIKDSTRED